MSASTYRAEPRRARNVSIIRASINPDHNHKHSVYEQQFMLTRSLQTSPAKQNPVEFIAAGSSRPQITISISTPTSSQSLKKYQRNRTVEKVKPHKSPRVVPLTDPFKVTARAAYNATARYITYTAFIISTSPIFHFLMQERFEPFSEFDNQQRGPQAITIATKRSKPSSNSSSSVHTPSPSTAPAFPLQTNKSQAPTQSSCSSSTSLPS
jgi:hypothetical protein